MNEVKMNFDLNFQLGIFELMLVDSDFSEKCLNYLKPEYFNNEHLAALFLMLKNLHTKYGAVPTKSQLGNELSQIVDPKRFDTLNQVFKKIIKPESTKDYVYIKDNLEKFVKRCVAFQIHGQIQANQNQDPDVILSKVTNSMEQLQSISFSKVKTESLANIEFILERSQFDSTNLVPTFLPTIDNALGGGVPRGTLTVGLSGTNAGKSIWLINWAYHLCKYGYKVFYVNLEGYENQPLIRLITRALQGQYGLIRNNQLTDAQREKVIEIKNTWGKNFQFFHNSSFGFTVEDLIPIVKAKKVEFDYDVLMVDYGQLLFSKKRFDNIRHEQAYVHRALTTISGEMNVAGVTVAQGNRDAQEKNSTASSLLRMTDMSECFEINRCAAQVFTLNRSERDKDMERVRILLEKQRDGATNIVEVCKTSFSRMSFYGHESEGLGFLNTQQYIQESNVEKK
jgi:replicative DNA helicase